MKPAVPPEARTVSLAGVAAMACESQQARAEGPEQALQTAVMEAGAGLPLVQQEPMMEDDAEEAAERYVAMTLVPNPPAWLLRTSSAWLVQGNYSLHTPNARAAPIAEPVYGSSFCPLRCLRSP